MGGIITSEPNTEQYFDCTSRLSVEILCNQLDETWNSFKQSFKMQVGVGNIINSGDIYIFS